MNEHPVELEAYVQGELPPRLANRVLEHLMECDSCLAKVEHLQQALPTGDLTQLQMENSPPSLAIERRLFRRLRRGDLSGTVIRFGTTGLMEVMLALVRPLFGHPAPAKDTGPTGPGDGVAR